jgi:hypothetical protein
MYILVNNGKFFAGKENNKLIWTDLSMLKCYPCQVILYPSQDSLDEDRFTTPKPAR